MVSPGRSKFSVRSPKATGARRRNRKLNQIQSEIQTAARRESSEDSMKRAFLLIVVPALLVALGFSQTPAPSVNTDQTNIKGCLGGSDGNYTLRKTTLATLSRSQPAVLISSSIWAMT